MAHTTITEIIKAIVVRNYEPLNKALLSSNEVNFAMMIIQNFRKKYMNTMFN